MKTVVLYTDGACKGNPGPGGYGVVLIYSARRKELSAGFRWTTNNRMELTALIKGLRALKEPCRVEIVSDSKYLLDAFQKEWIPKWKRNGWRTASRRSVRNRDLWEELDRLLATHKPQYRWVKGHHLNPENNRCDELAVAAANSENLLIDEAYETDNPFPSAKMMSEMLSHIRTLTASSEDRVTKARRLAQTIRDHGQYRWVGVYDVGAEEVAIIAWSGPGAPAYPTFSINRGLTSSAIRDKSPVIAGDVRNDRRYLTAFGSTLSEIIIPVLDDGMAVVGTIDVESERPNAFSEEDRVLLEQCAKAALPLWLTRTDI